MNFKKKILKNGMRIIVVPIEDAPSVTVMSLVEAGSEYETKEKNGISHFLEHMCFKGTSRRPRSIDISKEFDGMGAENNAFTGNEFTGYYGKAAAKYFEQILDIIADIYLNPSLPGQEMEKEKGVIIEEINMYEDLPQRKVHEVFAELLYGDTPYGWDIAGPKENIRAMRREDFVNYRAKHYVAPKTLIVVAGNVNEKDAFKKIEKAFKDIPTGKFIKKQRVPQSQTKQEIKIKPKVTDQAHLVIGVRTFDVHDKRNAALKLLSVILGNGMSSRLFQRMREELGICYYVRAGQNEFTDHGNFAISAGVDKSRIPEAVSGILAEMRKIRDELVSPEELKKAKDYYIGGMYLGLESSDALANFYGGQEIMREKIKTPKETEKEIGKITAEDIRKVARDIMKNDKLNMAIIGNPLNVEELKKLFVL
jgi:predicted Zn-dependent peptidase